MYSVAPVKQCPLKTPAFYTQLLHHYFFPFIITNCSLFSRNKHAKSCHCQHVVHSVQIGVVALHVPPGSSTVHSTVDILQLSLSTSFVVNLLLNHIESQSCNTFSNSCVNNILGHLNSKTHLFAINAPSKKRKFTVIDLRFVVVYMGYNRISILHVQLEISLCSWGNRQSSIVILS